MFSFLTSWPFFYSLQESDGTISEGLILPYPFVGFFILIIVFLTLSAGILIRKTTQMSHALAATQLALAKEQKMASLGALAAAAAHELGSPLSTISLAAKDILSMLSPDSAFLEDVQLVISQSDRCRDILVDLSENIRHDERLPYQALSLSAIIERAAHPHKLPQITLIIQKEAPDPEPRLSATPDLIHGLGNILQNSFQFAKSAVCVTLRWDKDGIEALIKDDGNGYPPHLLPRLGAPPSSPLKEEKGDDGRKSKGLGIGLFIAKTLLSQRHAHVHFFNDDGACCLIRWPGSMRTADSTTQNQASKDAGK